MIVDLLCCRGGKKQDTKMSNDNRGSLTIVINEEACAIWSEPSLTNECKSLNVRLFVMPFLRQFLKTISNLLFNQLNILD